MKEKLPDFLRKVKAGKYPVAKLDDVDVLSADIAKDINSTPKEVMEMLGFLLKNNYIKIDPNKGITLKEDDPEITKIIKMFTDS